jgi:DNA repair photolyase
VNDYDREGLEPNVPCLEKRIETFKRLADRVGPDRVIWRFDPLILTPQTPLDVLLEKVRKVGEQLHDHTRRLVFSFADITGYRKVRNNLDRCDVAWKDFTPEAMETFARELQSMNRSWGLEVATCGEAVDLSPWGVEHGRCIDDRLMIRLFPKDKRLMAFLGARPALFGKMEGEYIKDKGQRKECGCIVSKDIGMYNTCPHLCRYCYANTSEETVLNNRKAHMWQNESIIPF